MSNRAEIERIVLTQQQNRANGGYSQPEEAPAEEGVHQKKRMLPPTPKPNMLNQEMAEAAAVKYNKDKEKIQKACAQADKGKKRQKGQAQSDQGCCCGFL